MSSDVVKYAFIAGEISPTLFGRTDLTKYDLAVAEGLNFFVDYRGGLSSRPGFAFVDFVKADDKETRMFPFSFSPDLSNSYIVLFGDEYIRFIQDGAYVLSASKTITNITQASPGVVTSTSHGLTTGHWGKIVNVAGMTELNGRVFEIGTTTTHTFELLSVPDGTPFDTTLLTAYASGGLFKPIYEIASPFADTDLASLAVEQYRDLLRITSLDFPIHNLTRISHTNWSIAEEVISPYEEGPAITGSSTSAAGTAETVFAVTKVLADGSESSIGPLTKLDSIVNYTATEGSVSVTWAAEADADYYHVYRSIVSSSETLYSGVELGFVGRAFGTSFTDPNIIPDFTRAPQINYNPFAPSAVIGITITAPGTGYPAFGTTCTVTGAPGSGFDAEVITDAAGAVVNVLIKSEGEGYVSPSVSFGGGGSGATATATLRSASGTFPSLSAIFQQRQIYAASETRPITIWGSRIKQFSNFNSSPFVLDDDSFEFDLDTAAISPIRHLLVTRGGLLAMTQENVWLLNGGSAGEPITPSNALAEPQSYTGVGVVKPIAIGTDYLFTEGKGHAARMLTYNEISRVYGSDDKSILSNHLFGTGKDIIRWAYQESPYKVVWSIREDGRLMAFTSVKSEEVFAWTPCQTQGKLVDLCGLREGAEDRIYVTSHRFINDRWTKFIERMDLRQFINAEDAFCVDAGLMLAGASQSGTLTISHDLATDAWSATTSAAVLGPTVVGFFIRGANGIFKILTSPTTTSATLEMFAEPTNFIPELNDTITFPIEDWTLDEPTDTLSGLWHLEGAEVSILADGNVFERQTVVDGSITLDHPVTRAIVGLGFTCRAKTLPVIIPDQGIEAKRKRIAGIGVRMDKSRGIKLGPQIDDVLPMRERTDEPYGHPVRLISGVRYALLRSEWNEEGQTYFIQNDPLPVNILSIVSEIEVGDESD